MERIGQYLVSITAAAVICGIVLSLLDKKSAHYPLIQILCGVFMSVTILAPVTDFRLPNMKRYFSGLDIEAQAAVQSGRDAAEETLEGIIKSRTETYILDKASSMGLDISVEVTLAEGELPQPCSVRIQGEVAPYSKRQLQWWIRDTLGILEEDQIWGKRQ